MMHALKALLNQMVALELVHHALMHEAADEPRGQVVVRRHILYEHPE